MEFFNNIDWNIFLRLFVAMIMGVAIGLERTVAHKTAGMRTYGLVSMGAALFVIVSIIMTQQYSNITSLDPLRMASQIIMGIGFLGAGLIIFRESTLSGLTTAAGLWVAGGIGTAVGFGLYTIAIFATILTLFIFSILWVIENKIKKITENTKNK